MNKPGIAWMSVGACALGLGLSWTQLYAAPSAGRRITSKSVGPVRLGMTVAAARKALKGFTLERASDGDGAALIAVVRGKNSPMSLYAGEDDASAPIHEKAVIEFIEVTDRDYATKAGVHPGMSLKEAARIYGKVKEIEMSEIEAREYATFSREPAGLTFRVRAASGVAGLYPPEKAGDPSASRHASKYAPDARIYSIGVSIGFQKSR